MKLSIVIPAYNEEAYLGDCLRGIFKELESQKLNVEVIVVNNSSTDKTKEIALSFPGVIVVDEPKKGLVNARHAGFVVSKGELIANVDADTVMPKGWIKEVLKEFSSNPGLVALSGPFIFYDLSKLTNFFVRVYYLGGYLVHLTNHHLLRIGALLQGGNFIVRRTAMEEIGGFNKEYDFYGEDADVARRMRKVGKVKFSFKLPMGTSGRRLKEEGVIVMGSRYLVNYIWTVFLKKPFTKKQIDIRP